MTTFSSTTNIDTSADTGAASANQNIDEWLLDPATSADGQLAKLLIGKLYEDTGELADLLTVLCLVLGGANTPAELTVEMFALAKSQVPGLRSLHQKLTEEVEKLVELFNVVSNTDEALG